MRHGAQKWFNLNLCMNIAEFYLMSVGIHVWTRIYRRGGIVYTATKSYVHKEEKKGKALPKGVRHRGLLGENGHRKEDCLRLQ